MTKIAKTFQFWKKSGLYKTKAGRAPSASIDFRQNRLKFAKPSREINGRLFKNKKRRAVNSPFDLIF